jgi:hypothetical protein
MLISAEFAVGIMNGDAKTRARRVLRIKSPVGNRGCINFKNATSISLEDEKGAKTDYSRNFSIRRQEK